MAHFLKRVIIEKIAFGGRGEATENMKIATPFIGRLLSMHGSGKKTLIWRSASCWLLW